MESDRSAPPQPVKPLLRGWLHAGVLPFAVVAGLVLVALASDERARIACAVYAATAITLFSVSALYHRGAWSPRVAGVLRRLDHANIFLIIAGTYTPFSLLLLRGAAERVLLSVIWVGALAGIGFRVLWIGAPRWLYTPVYLALGWAAVFVMPDFLRRGGVAVLTLVIAGGLAYSLGALVYGIKRPNPSPRWFGFHEVFHSFTLVGFVTHYVGISLIAYAAHS